jgi:hypothetical protein
MMVAADHALPKGGSHHSVAKLHFLSKAQTGPRQARSLFPTLDPFAKAVYFQLYLLSHGFHRDTCVVGLLKLSQSVLMSKRKVQDTIVYLEKRGLIRRLRAVMGGPSKGNIYKVPLPTAETAPTATVAGHSTWRQAPPSHQVPRRHKALLWRHMPTVKGMMMMMTT